MNLGNSSRDRIAIAFYLAGLFMSLLFVIFRSSESIIGIADSPLEGLALIMIAGVAFILFLFSFIIGRYIPFIRYSLSLIFILLFVAGLIKLMM